VIGGEITADEAARLGASVLGGDPLEAARAIAASPPSRR
jgi:hypothetical protein